MSLTIFTKTFAAAEAQTIMQLGTYIRCLAGAANFDCEPIAPDGQSLGIFSGFQLGLAFRTPRPFDRVRILNGSTAQGIQIATSDDQIDDSRLVGTVAITGGIASKVYAPDLIDISNTFTVTSAVTTFGIGSLTNTQIGELMIQNLGLVDVFVGPFATVTAANGIKIPAAAATGTTQMGGMLVLQTSANIGGITSGGSSDVRVMRTRHT